MNADSIAFGIFRFDRMPIGVLTNCTAVLLGGLLGTALGKILPQGLKDNLPTLFGFCSIAIGVNSIIKASGMTAVVLAILVGFAIGHSLHAGFVELVRSGRNTRTPNDYRFSFHWLGTP